MKTIIIRQKLPSVKRKIENGNVTQSNRIPPLSTLTEKPGIIDLHTHRGEARVVNNTIKKPLSFKRKSIKISRAPSLTNTEHIQKEKKTPRICNPTNSPISPSKNTSTLPTLVQNTHITNKKEINKKNNYKQNSSKISVSIKSYAKKNTKLKKKSNEKPNDRVTNIKNDINNKKEETHTKSSSTSTHDTVWQQWICCTVNNRDCKSLVEMPTTYAQNKGKLGASTMPRLFKNYHQEKLAKINEEIRYINSLCKSKVKLVQQENNQPGLKEKVKKISEEIREMNAKRPPPKVIRIKPIPGVRELLRKKVEQLNREIRLTNKKRTYDYRRCVFIRHLKKIAMKLDEYQKEKNSKKKMSASKEGTFSREKNKLTPKKRYRNTLKKFKTKY